MLTFIILETIRVIINLAQVRYSCSKTTGLTSCSESKGGRLLGRRKAPSQGDQKQKQELLRKSQFDPISLVPFLVSEREQKPLQHDFMFSNLARSLRIMSILNTTISFSTSPHSISPLTLTIGPLIPRIWSLDLNSDLTFRTQNLRTRAPVS
jgi:hypothetical protein